MTSSHVLKGVKALAFYHLLFEDYQTKDLALVKVKAAFVLYDVKALMKLAPVKSKYSKSGFTPWVLKPVIAAWVKLRKPVEHITGKCAGAWNIAYSVRNPAYPGSAMLLVKLASSAMGVPITSDRQVSSSKAAQAMWDRVADDPSFTAVELDNYRSSTKHNDPYPQTYFDFPNRKVKDRKGPKTPDPSDDCFAPGDDKGDVQQHLGSENAYESHLSSKLYLARHDKAVVWMKATYNLGQIPFENMLSKSGAIWFNTLYEGAQK